MMTSALAGCYVDYFTLGRGVLRMLGEIHGTRISAGDMERIKQPMLTMPAHPDMADGLAGLRDDGFRLVTLTNSPPNPLGPSPLESAGLGGFFERQFSVDACHTYKPARDVYHYVCRELQVVPAECMMVAARLGHHRGAKRRLHRGADYPPGNAPLPLEGLPRPTLVAADLRQLAQQPNI